MSVLHRVPFESRPTGRAYERKGFVRSFDTTQNLTNERNMRKKIKIVSETNEAYARTNLWLRTEADRVPSASLIFETARSSRLPNDNRERQQLMSKT